MNLLLIVIFTDLLLSIKYLLESTLKGGMETNMVLYLALNKICLKDFSEAFPETLKSIESSLKSFCESFNIFDTTKTYHAEYVYHNSFP